MSEPASPPAPPPPSLREGLRLVLFGMPGAGKTSLLGALAQAAQSQEHLLHGRLTTTAEGLELLRHQLYDEGTRPTAEEVVLYPVEFEPFGQERMRAVFIDCDGRVANDLLMRRQALAPDGAEGPLAQEVLAADTLILVVDASAPASQVEADFAEFRRFLRLLERGRGERSEVGGLPVFLVLTKCDLIAQSGEAPVDWIERVEERKRQVGQRFRDFLARRDDDDGPLPFGRIDLHLWATAVKRPALAGSPARPREPYGVAELFRQCLDQAGLFHRRRRQSSRRLVWTVAGSTVVVAAMAGLTVALLSGRREPPPPPLQNRVEAYQLDERDKTVAERLKGSLPQLRDKLGRLTALREDPDFTRLPPPTRDYVQDQLRELTEYIDFYQKLQLATAPAAARSEKDLRQIEQQLRTDLAVPREAWAQTTAAGRQHQDYLDQVAALRSAVADVEEWYRQRRKEGDRLWSFAGRQPEASGKSVDWRAWQGDVEKLFAQAEPTRFRPDERLPGPGGATYGETVYRFDRVADARADWESIRRQLQRLLDISFALGLAGPLGDRPAMLAIPRKPPFTLTEARDRLQRLQAAYPRYRETFTREGLPAVIVGDISQAAAAGYEQLLEAGREAVLRQLQLAGTGSRETSERWAEVRKWLQSDPEELKAWRELARVLTGLKEGTRIDPVSELTEFLGRERFPLELRRLSLVIPDQLATPNPLRVEPDGLLSLYHLPTSKKSPALTFRVTGGVQRDPSRRVSIYTLSPTDDRSTLTYRPGDELWATLPLKDRDGDKRDNMLTWARSRSEVFQVERLSQPPRIHRRDQDNTAGDIAPGVQLTTDPPGGIPLVPELVPVVRLQK